MSFSAVLKRGANSLSLSVSADWQPPSLAGEVVILGGSGPADPVLASERIGVPATMTVPLVFSAASQSALVEDVAEVNDFLRGGPGLTLEVTFEGSSTASTWSVIHAQPVQPSFANWAQLACWVAADLVLTVVPFTLGSAVTLHDEASLTTPGYVSLSAMDGVYRAPLTIAVSSVTAADLGVLYVAYDPDGYSSHLQDAKDLTWGTGATEYADAAARVDNAVKIASTTAVSADLVVTDYPAGRYLLLARVKANGGATGTISVDVTEGTEGEIEFDNSSWAIVELGTCYLPSRAVKGSADATITVSVASSSDLSGEEACIDWLCPVPVGHGFFCWAPSSGTATTVERDPSDGTTYVDDEADEGDVTGCSIMALGGQLLVISQNADGDERTQSTTVTVTYTPRHGWMR